MTVVLKQFVSGTPLKHLNIILRNFVVVKEKTYMNIFTGRFNVIFFLEVMPLYQSNAYPAIHYVYHCRVMGECGVYELAHYSFLSKKEFKIIQF